MSAEMCQNLLAALHKKMMDKVEQHLLLSPQDDEDGYSFQSSEFKVGWHLNTEHIWYLITNRAIIVLVCVSALLPPLPDAPV